MNTKKVILSAVLTAFALVAFVIESAMPPVVPIYGVKIGLANVFTLFALYALGKRSATAVLLIRVSLAAVFAGQAVSLFYSLTGGVLSLLLMISLKRFFPVKRLWALSVLSAVMHNIGQLTAAVILTSTPQILFYFPILVVSGIIAGAVTGLCAQLVLLRLKHIYDKNF